MGYNTTVVIMNDAFDEIKKHPQEFVDNLFATQYAAQYIANSKKDVAVGNYVNAARVVACDHADIHNVIATGGNYEPF
jgi:hypothetical protein